MKLKTIKGEFEPHYMNNSKSILDYFDHVQIIVNQMQVNGEKLDDQRIVEKIMWFLSEKFDYVVATIKEGKYIFTSIVEGSMSSLYSHK